LRNGYRPPNRCNKLLTTNNGPQTTNFLSWIGLSA
jgi:hypothetical protein